MTTVHELHQQAMALAQEAMLARQEGDFNRAYLLSAQALPLEIEAAHKIPKVPESEPSRSILYLSAATLAYQSNDAPLAKRLAFDALSGFPPPRAMADLYELLENLDVSLQTVNSADVLIGSQMQLAIEGTGVGHGSVPYRSFEDRARATVSILQSTALRSQGYEFGSGNKGRMKNRLYMPVISTPTPGSFRVIIELVRREDGQESLFTTGETVVDQVITGVKMVQEGQLDDLRKLISNELYFRSFVTLAQLLAPDGELVQAVALTSPRGGASLTRTRKELEVPIEALLLSQKVDHSLVASSTIRGTLVEASIRKDQRVILRQENGKTLTLWVNEAIDELVRGYFDREVEVKVQTRGERMEIITFSAIEDS